MHNYYKHNRGFFSGFNRIHVYLSDPGATAVLRIVGRYLENKGYPIEYVTTGWSKRNHILEGEAKPLQNENGLFSSPTLNSRSLVIYGARKDFILNYALSDRCKQNNMLTLFVFDHWKNYLVNFRNDASGSLYLPSRIAVIDSPMKRALCSVLSPYVSTDYFNCIDIIGNPAIDESVAYLDTMSDEFRTGLKARYNPMGKNLILLILEPIQDDFGADRYPGYNEFTIIDYFFKHQYSPDTRALVKPHPRHNMKVISSYFQERYGANGFDVQIIQHEKIENLISISDLVVGMTSISMIPAIKINKPVISLQIDRNDFGKTLSNPYLERCLDIGH
jgi:hypothetical protein|tara:strand:+ start:3605 stop:4603 length:999 start_codon:yes stop_codon:yes gene_type:complete